MSDDINEAERDVGFDARTGTYRVRYDDGTRKLSYTLVTTVSAVSGEQPESLAPLHDAVDTDALNTLFDPTAGGRTLDTGRVVFEYEGFEVTVRGDGILEIQPSEERRIGDLGPPTA